MAAESERIGDKVVDGRFPGFVGNVIEIALRIGVLVIDRVRRYLVFQGKSAGYALHRSGGAQQMTDL